MADKPILFSGPMVRALLAGTKTQTRRDASKAITYTDGKPVHIHGGGGGCFCGSNDEAIRENGPYYMRFVFGDRLYVREHWRTRARWDDVAPRDMPSDTPVEYVATATGDNYGRFRQGMHMPRWASRITLTVTDVRVERLQDISEDDAFAEGIDTNTWDMAPVARNYGEEDAWFVGWPMGILPPSLSVEAGEVCRRSYETLWDKINGAGAWAANPWVAAYTFTVERGNIDQLRAAA